PLPRDMLAEHLLRRFRELEETNAARRRETNWPDRWPKERQRLVQAYQRMLGAFPERTPLNARVTGRLERDRYAIEKLLFESQPGMRVTANVYVPHGIPRGERRPAVLVPCGHSETGKAAETYQRVCIGLASKGYVVLIYDPIGQGERQTYWNAATGRSDLGGNTTQHSYVGNQCFLLGINLAQYMVWDSIRAVDYLVSRADVDPERIGMAGNSGGGTNTAQTVPLDPRIKAAAVCCYITTLCWRRRAWSTGDAEQNLAGQLADGLDLPDYLRLMAPRPVLVGSAALDYFPLEGAKQGVEIAGELYRALGVPERVTHAVADAPHGYSPTLRRATFAWMNRWLGMPDAGDDEPDVAVESDADLQVTPDGQVAALGSEDVFTLNRRRLALPAPERRRNVRESAAALTGWESPHERPVARETEQSLFRYEGVRRIETVTVWPESDVAVPGRVFSWRAALRPGPAVVWLDAEGVDAAVERPAFRALLARQSETGCVVAVVDVRGVGETAPRDTGRANRTIMGAEAFLTYESFIAGTPLLGMRLRDAACAVDYVLGREDVDTARGALVVGWGGAGLLALHIAALDERVAAVTVVDAPESYRSLVESERYDLSVSWMAPGMVRNPDSPDGYDVEELCALIAPRAVYRLPDSGGAGRVAALFERELSAGAAGLGALHARVDV
ncbi:MAG TPA: acetylxylan esterase, partial [Chloroflexota bacterium]|nr:acetylxylan esterase [Chloroflexota bacterium]